MLSGLSILAWMMGGAAGAHVDPHLNGMVQPDSLSSFKRVGVRRYSSRQKLFSTVLLLSSHPIVWLFKKAARKVNEPGNTDIKLPRCGSAAGYFFSFCQRTKWLWTWRHLISCKKSLWKVKVARVSKVKNLWLSGSSACRAGGMVITELSRRPVSLLIKGWADNSSAPSSHPEKRR